MNFMGNPYTKVCTFTRRVQFSQLFTYSLILCQLVIFLAGIQTNYASSSNRVVMLVLILLSFSVMFLTCFKVSSTDPVDTILLEYRNGDPKKVQSLFNSCYYCDSCNSYVKNTSKHCKICDRCVDRFDHHCTWVNNCIGEENYSWFFAMIVSAFLYMLFFCVAVGLLYQQQNWQSFMPAMVISWIVVAVTLPVCILLLVLVCFHVILMRKGLTTFEFIMLQREQEEAKLEQGKAKDENINKTNENIMPVESRQGVTAQEFKGTIFQNSQQSSEEYSNKLQIKKAELSTNNKVSKTLITQSGEQKSTNENEMKQFFIRHKSLKFLVGQSLVVQDYRPNNYQSLKHRQAATEMQRRREKAYRSTKNRQDE